VVNILVLGQKLAKLIMALEQYLQLLLMEYNFYRSKQISEFLIKAHQVNATHKMVNKWSRKARKI
jgi:hypothetical protein